MTATRFTRTLAIAVYADLDTSIIDELPPGRRTPIQTIVIPKTVAMKLLRRVQHRLCA